MRARPMRAVTTARLGLLLVLLVSEAVTAQAAKDPDYRLTRADVTDWEARHGRIPRGAMVVLRTGWASRWPDAKGFLFICATIIALPMKIENGSGDPLRAIALVPR